MNHCSLTQSLEAFNPHSFDFSISCHPLSLSSECAKASSSIAWILYEFDWMDLLAFWEGAKAFVRDSLLRIRVVDL